MQKKWWKWITVTLGIFFLLLSFPMLSYQGAFFLGCPCLLLGGMILFSHLFIPLFLRRVQSQNGDYSLLMFSNFRYLKRIFITVSLFVSVALFLLSPVFAKMMEQPILTSLLRIVSLFPVPLVLVGIYSSFFQMKYWKSIVRNGNIWISLLALLFYFLGYFGFVFLGKQSVLFFFQIWFLFCLLLVLLEYGYFRWMSKKQEELLSKVDLNSKKISIRKTWKDNKILLLVLFSMLLLFLSYRVLFSLSLPAILHHKFYMSISRVEEVMSCYWFYSFFLQLPMLLVASFSVARFLKRETSSSLLETAKKVVEYWSHFLSKFFPILIFLILISSELFGVIYGINEGNGLLFGLDLAVTLLFSLVIVLECFLFRFGSYRILIVGNLLFLVGKCLFSTSFMTSFYKMGTFPILGVLVSDACLFVLLLVLFLIRLHHLAKSSYEKTIRQVMGYLTSCTLAGALTLLVKKLIFMVLPTSRILSFVVLSFLALLFVFSYRLAMKFQQD